MPTKKASAEGDGAAERSRVEQLLDPLGVVLLTRERIQETLEEAVERGRVTRSDANDLAVELLRRGRQQTDELVAEIERVLDAGRGHLEEAGRRSGLTRLARTADRARRTVTGTSDADSEDSLPIPGYDELTARQVQVQLAGLTPAELRQVREYERRHANRKTVLDAVERLLD
jgi:polyhydroxyalkanoate synthesis regulator phasin